MLILYISLMSIFLINWDITHITCKYLPAAFDKSHDARDNLIVD